MIMVGEIRDSETVSIGVRAALVGRLFLSTLHTNDATAAVPRLLDMGVEPFLLASTLVLVMAQRLARRICVACRESAAPSRARSPHCARGPTSSVPCAVLQAQGVLGPGHDPLAAVRIFQRPRLRAVPGERLPRSHRALRAVRGRRRGPPPDHGAARRRARSGPPPSRPACGPCSRTASPRCCSARPRWRRSTGSRSSRPAGWRAGAGGARGSGDTRCGPGRSRTG